jgi:hypothetical protein
MIPYDNLTRASALVLALAGLIVVGAATVVAAPAHGAPSAFELTIDGRDTFRFDDEVAFFRRHGTFKSKAPFCATGALEQLGPPLGTRRWLFECDDGSGSVTLSTLGWYEGAGLWSSGWHIVEGSGSYVGLQGRGSMQGGVLDSGETSSPWSRWETWRSSFQGVVDRDTVAPAIAFSRAKAEKLPRSAGSYTLRLGIGLRDDVSDNTVSYTVRVTTPRGIELARRIGTTTAGGFSLTLLIRPPAGTRTVRLALTGVDPVGNATSVRRLLRLPAEAPRP